jgi:hypothetical protein
MLATKHTAVLRKCRDDVLDELVLVNGVGFLVQDVYAVAAGEPYPQHDVRHSLKLDVHDPRRVSALTERSLVAGH